jgi:hypothetical protein
MADALFVSQITYRNPARFIPKQGQIRGTYAVLAIE